MKKMIKTLTKVKSGMIYAVGYDPKEKLLEVIFTKGATWVYEDVPEEEYNNLINSDSIGSYMHSYIIDCYSSYKIS